MDVSVVIVNYNTRSYLDACLSSVYMQTTCSHEIFVIDNNSTDGSIEMVKTKYPSVHLIINDHNAGFAKANNQGFRKARGKYFFMLNPDTVVMDNAIDKLVNFMEHYKEVGICSPKNVGNDGELQFNCDHFPSIWNIFCEYFNLNNLFPQFQLFRRSRMQYWDYSSRRSVDRVMGCSLLIRADIYKSLNGLDEKYFMYFEETDLCYRTFKNGFQTIFMPEAVIVHHGGQSALSQPSEKRINKTVTSYFKNSQYFFFKKNYGLLSMFTIRALDFFYGTCLYCRNIFRIDSELRANRKNKAFQLIKHSIQF